MTNPTETSANTSTLETVGGTNGGRVSDIDRAFSSQLLSAVLRFKDGDFSSQLPADLPGIDGKIADAFNDVLAVSARRASEIARACRVVGKEGKLKQRMN